jgi:hypothetical protein
LMTWELEVRLLAYVVCEIPVLEGILVLKKVCLGVLDKDEQNEWMHETMVSRLVGVSELGRERARQQHRRDVCASNLRRFVRPCTLLSRFLPKEIASTHIVIIHRKSGFQNDFELILVLVYQQGDNLVEKRLRNPIVTTSFWFSVVNVLRFELSGYS